MHGAFFFKSKIHLVAGNKHYCKDKHSLHDNIYERAIKYNNIFNNNQFLEEKTCYSARM